MTYNKSFLAASLTTFIWGFSYISTKVLVYSISPYLLVFYRFLISSAFLLILLKLREKKLHIRLVDLPRFLFTSIIGYTVYFLLESNGIKLTSASIASIIIGTIPILSLLTDVIFFKNRLTGVKLISVALSFAGILMVIGNPTVDRINPLGVLLVFGAASCWIFFNYMNQPLYFNYSTLAITTWQTLIALVSMLFVVLIKEKNLLISVNSEQFLHIVFLGLAASAGGFLFYIYALKNLGVVATTLFVNFIPVTTMLTGRIFLNEHLTSLQWIGGFIIVISLYTGSILSSKNSVKTVPKDSKTG